MLTEQQLDNLIENVPNQFTDTSVSNLYKRSNWDLDSCKWFIWELKYGLKASLSGYASAKYGKIYLPELSMFGITRFAPMGSRKQRKNLEKISKQMGSFNLQAEYKDVASKYNDYLTVSTVQYLASGATEILMGLLDDKTFIPTLESWTHLLFKDPKSTLESSELEKWDPYLLQDFIVNEINEKNKKIIEENKSKKDNKEKLLLIPENFDVIKDREKISPL
ncbi:hypothetical protein OA169_01440 [Acidimicrobiaceae bacterium]|nr:hypothetical protein [Acidimicrobiaceae bacterium]